MTSAQEIVFRHCRLDGVNQLLWRGARVIPLRQKSFAVLQYLVEHPGQLVTKEELLKAVWSESYVSDVAVKVCIRELRHALGDQRGAPQFIETVHRRGYRFIAPLVSTSQPVSDSWLPVSDYSEASGWGRETRLPSFQASSLMPQVSHFVGREAELERLQGWLAKALRGERQIVFVTGEPGIGKTTFVEAFLQRAGAMRERSLQAGGVWLARGQCIEHYGAGEAYLPVLEALGRLCREPSREHFIALLRRLAPLWFLQIPALIAPAERKKLQREIPGATQECMLREMVDVVEALTGEGTVHEPPLLVLVLEDLHWSDYSTLDLISYLARRREPARLLLIGTYRPVEVMNSRHPLKAVKQELQAHGRCKELPLGFLTEAEVGQYLERRFTIGATGRSPRLGLARTLHQRTEGNPLFMINMAEDLVAQGAIVQMEGQWELRRAVEEIVLGVPENIQQMVEKQIERLSPEEQRVLEAASVAGIEFSVAAVAIGLEAEAVQIEELCNRLARRTQFLQLRGVSQWPDGTVAARYGFMHALYQNVVYETVTVGRRTQLHQRIGEGKERGYGTQTQEIAAELAMHFEQGRDYRRAVQYLRQAAENASMRGAYREVIGYSSRGLELLKALPGNPDRLQSELDLQIRLAIALQAHKGLAVPEAEQAYARAWELCQQTTDTRALLYVLRGLYGVYQWQAQWQRARELAEQGCNLAEEVHDVGFLIDAHCRLGNTLFSLGELIPARVHFDKGIALYDRHEHQPLPEINFSFATFIYCLHSLASVLCALGYPDQALKRNQEALTLALQHSHPYVVAVVLNSTAGLHLARREWQTAQERAEAVIALAKEHGFAHFVTMGTAARGKALVQQGYGGEGIAQIRQGLATYEATGAEAAKPSYLGWLARAYGKAGRIEEGLTIVAEALAAASKLGQPVAWLYWIKGELTLQSSVQSLASSVHKEAEEYFHKAIDIAHRQGAKWFELHVVMSLGRLWQQQGKRKEARQMLAEIYSWFTEGFNTMGLKEAKELLDELS